MTDPLARARRQAHELRKAELRRDAVYAARDEAIRAARAGGMQRRPIGEMAGLGLKRIEQILASGSARRPGTAAELSTLMDEVHRIQLWYAERRFRRDLAIHDAIDAGCTRADVALAARLKPYAINTILRPGRPEKPRLKRRPGNAGSADWDRDRERHARLMRQWREADRAGELPGKGAPS